ncbi:MAG: 4-hydroxyphenylacetate 3-hydroxylase N-terminal domain-containing protein [Bacillota bacterium]
MPLMTAGEYLDSLRRMKPTVYILGERVDSPTEDPHIRASINATAATYELAFDQEYRHIALVESPLTGGMINRFNHVASSIEDLVARVKINRVLGQRVGTCFQRCTGLDGLSALSITTYNMDRRYGTQYHQRFLGFLRYMQENDYSGHIAVTDVKGDRSKRPHQQADPDLYLRVVERNEDGIVVRGAKAHQTGSLNSHETIVLPTTALQEADTDYAVAFSIPVDTPGLVHIYGRGTLDSREVEGVDLGNCFYGKYCTLVVFDDVFVPWDRVFMCGEWEFAGEMVSRFSSYHRQSHGGCKSGLLDVVSGAAYTMAEYNGTAKVSHIREKLTDIIHRAETIYACTLASSYEGHREPSGTYAVNSVLANAAKIHEGRDLVEAMRLLLDIAGGLVGTMPSELDLQNPATGAFLEKYLKGVEGVQTRDRMRMFRLVEKLAMESRDLVSAVHGGGSPQAHRLTILRETDLEAKARLARRLAGIQDGPSPGLAPGVRP